MKVLLIAANSESALSDTIPDKYKDLSLGNYPPLGLMYLSSYLKKYSKHVPEIIDMGADGLSETALIEIARDRNPDVIGFYTTSFNLNRVYRIASQIKRLNSKTVTVLGGPHVDLYAKETASLKHVDFSVSGEGEITLTELLNCIEKNEDLSLVKGIAYKDSSGTRVNEARPIIGDLDILPLPDRNQLDYKKYYSVIGKNQISTTIMTSRGCPYRCNFCFSQYGGRYRSRSVGNVLAEMNECVKLGIKEFFIFDEIFTLNKARVMEFCRVLIEKKYGVIFDIRSRIDTMDMDMLSALKSAGCARIQYGVESGSDRILKLMNKGITVEKAREVVKMTKRAGIDVLIDFMIGYPGENRQEIAQTIEFAAELNPEFVQFGIVTYFPGIKIYEDALRNGTVREDFWRNVAMNPPESIVPPFASDVLSRQELEKCLHDAYVGYYFRLRSILKMLLKLPDPVQLVRQARAAYALLRSK